MDFKILWVLMELVVIQQPTWIPFKNPLLLQFVISPLGGANRKHHTYTGRINVFFYTLNLVCGGFSITQSLEDRQWCQIK